MNTSPKAEGKHMSMDFENTGTVSRLTMQGRELCSHEIVIIMMTHANHQWCNGP